MKSSSHNVIPKGATPNKVGDNANRNSNKPYKSLATVENNPMNTYSTRSTMINNK